MPTTNASLTWTTEKDGWGVRTYTTTLPDGRRVTITPTGQRNGRTFGAAWRASTGWGPDAVTLATGGTLASCKASVSRLAAEQA